MNLFGFNMLDYASIVVIAKLKGDVGIDSFEGEGRNISRGPEGFHGSLEVVLRGRSLPSQCISFNVSFGHPNFSSSRSE